ncbi:Cutinase domain-containing protein [Rhizoctonia solani AG-1 IA]|uniref:cutinase n=1 Tax=Thanatephorus cucumeris (strain AG1-IA) TaxID=983506 RepID=L8WZG8_THACA|nr:Cutinase domain-containing protein [Rhizoctonia solani AG-1 IA]
MYFEARLRIRVASGLLLYLCDKCCDTIFVPSLRVYSGSQAIRVSALPVPAFAIRGTNVTVSNKTPCRYASRHRNIPLHIADPIYNGRYKSRATIDILNDAPDGPFGAITLASRVTTSHPVANTLTLPAGTPLAEGRQALNNYRSRASSTSLIALVSTFLMPQGHGKSPVQALWVDLLEPYLQMPFQGPLAMASRTALARSTIKHLQKWAVIWAQYLHDQASRCPDQRFVLSGVSKGAMLIHTLNLDDESKAKVFSVLAFGDGWGPNAAFNNSWPVNSPSVGLDPRDDSTSAKSVASFCNKGDTGCEIRTIDPNAIPPEHLSYPTGGSIEAAVKFVKAALKWGFLACDLPSVPFLVYLNMARFDAFNKPPCWWSKTLVRQKLHCHSIMSIACSPPLVRARYFLGILPRWRSIFWLLGHLKRFRHHIISQQACYFVCYIVYNLSRMVGKTPETVTCMGGAFTPLGLTLMQELAQRGAQIIALTPSLADPTIEGFVSAIREVTSNALIYAEECDITSPTSIRAFCKQFLAITPTGPSTNMPGVPKDPPRLDALILAHEYTHIGAGWGVNKSLRAVEENIRLEGGLASFLLITLLLPCLIRAPNDRDIRIINVVNPLYAASVPTYVPPTPLPKPSEMKDGTPAPPQPPAENITVPELAESKGSFRAQLEKLALASVSSLEGHRSLRSILLVRHLQRVLDALASQSNKPVLGTNKEAEVISVKKQATSNITAVTVAPGFSRVQTVGPYLRARKESVGFSTIGFYLYVLIYPGICLFAKHSLGAAQTVLYTLFAPTLRTRISEPSPKSKDDTRDDAKPEFIPRIQGGLLYRECAPTQLPGRGVALFETEGIGRAVWEELERGVEVWERSEGEVLKEMAKEVEKEAKDVKGKGKEKESAKDK